MSSAYIPNYFTTEKSKTFDMAVTEGQFTDYYRNIHFTSCIKKRRGKNNESRNNVKKTELSNSFTNQSQWRIKRLSIAKPRKIQEEKKLRKRYGISISYNLL